MALLIHPDGTQEEVEPENGTDFQWQELHDMVDGYIEMVRPFHPQYPNHYLVLNEEGKLKGMGVNEKATKIYANPQDVIVGSVLLCLDTEVL
jgi:hypothetical protein